MLSFYSLIEEIRQDLSTQDAISKMIIILYKNMFNRKKFDGKCESLQKLVVNKYDYINEFVEHAICSEALRLLDLRYKSYNDKNYGDYDRSKENMMTLINLPYNYAHISYQIEYYLDINKIKNNMTSQKINELTCKVLLCNNIIDTASEHIKLLLENNLLDHKMFFNCCLKYHIFNILKNLFDVFNFGNNKEDEEYFINLLNLGKDKKIGSWHIVHYSDLLIQFIDNNFIPKFDIIDQIVIEAKNPISYDFFKKIGYENNYNYLVYRIKTASFDYKKHQINTLTDDQKKNICKIIFGSKLRLISIPDLKRLQKLYNLTYDKDCMSTFCESGEDLKMYEFLIANKLKPDIKTFGKLMKRMCKNQKAQKMIDLYVE